MKPITVWTVSYLLGGGAMEELTLLLILLIVISIDKLISNVKK